MTVELFDLQRIISSTSVGENLLDRPVSSRRVRVPAVEMFSHIASRFRLVGAFFLRARKPSRPDAMGGGKMVGYIGLDF